MYILKAVDIGNAGPDGQTQDFDVAVFNRESDADVMVRMLNTKFKGKFSFYHYEETESLLVNPTYLKLVNTLEDLLES